jgi:hypothetical protein
MVIRYAEDGRIVSCTADDWETEEAASEDEQVLRIHDEELPEDFVRTFAAGKYLVRKGKVVKNRAYQPPEPVDVEDPLPFLPGSHPDPDGDG